ncbi:unnamed protein product [Gordionus sp. m RMFG-2023]
MANSVPINVSWEMTSYLKEGLSLEIWNHLQPSIVYPLTHKIESSNFDKNLVFLPDEDSTTYEIQFPGDLKCQPYCIMRASTKFGNKTSNRRIPKNQLISHSCSRIIVVENEGLVNCSNRGIYTETDSGKECVCDWLYSGKYCQYKDECYESSDCYDNGKCVDVISSAAITQTNEKRNKDFYSSHVISPRGVCFCKDGWFGPSCRRKSLAKSINPINMASVRLDPGFQIYWKILELTGELEVIIVADTKSWILFGWAPKDTLQNCGFVNDKFVSRRNARQEEKMSCYDTILACSREDNLNRVFDFFTPYRVFDFGSSDPIQNNVSEGVFDFSGIDKSFKFSGSTRAPRGRDNILDASTHEENGVTFVYFKKKLRVYDNADIEVSNQTMNIIWAKGRSRRDLDGNTNSYMNSEDLFMLRDIRNLDMGVASINFIKDYEDYMRNRHNSLPATNPKLFQSSTPLTDSNFNDRQNNASPNNEPRNTESPQNSQIRENLSQPISSFNLTNLDNVNSLQNSSSSSVYMDHSDPDILNCDSLTLTYPPGCLDTSANCHFAVTVNRDRSHKNNGRFVVTYVVTKYIDAYDAIELNSRQRRGRDQFTGIMMSRHLNRKSTDVVLGWKDRYGAPMISDMFTTNFGSTLYMDTSQDIFRASLKKLSVGIEDIGNITLVTAQPRRQKIVLSFNRLTAPSFVNTNEPVKSAFSLYTEQDIFLSSSPDDSNDCFYFFMPSYRKSFEAMDYLISFAGRRNFSGSDRENFYPYFEPISIKPVCMNFCDKDQYAQPDSYSYQNELVANLSSSQGNFDNNYNIQQQLNERPLKRVALPANPTIFDFPRRHLQGLEQAPSIVTQRTIPILGKYVHEDIDQNELKRRNLNIGQSHLDDFQERNNINNFYNQKPTLVEINGGSGSLLASATELINGSNSLISDGFKINIIEKAENDKRGLDNNNNTESNTHSIKSMTLVFKTASNYNDNLTRPSTRYTVKVHSGGDYVKETPKTQFCTFTPDPGPCFQYVSKWFFDTTTLACIQFAYGGCRGSLNRFDSKEQCTTVCRPVVERLKFRAYLAKNPRLPPSQSNITTDRIYHSQVTRQFVQNRTNTQNNLSSINTLITENSHPSLAAQLKSNLVSNRNHGHAIKEIVEVKENKILTTERNFDYRNNVNYVNANNFSVVITSKPYDTQRPNVVQDVEPDAKIQQINTDSDTAEGIEVKKIFNVNDFTKTNLSILNDENHRQVLTVSNSGANNNSDIYDLSNNNGIPNKVNGEKYLVNVTKIGVGSDMSQHSDENIIVGPLLIDEESNNNQATLNNSTFLRSSLSFFPFARLYTNESSRHGFHDDANVNEYMPDVGNFSKDTKAEEYEYRLRQGDKTKDENKAFNSTHLGDNDRIHNFTFSINGHDKNNEEYRHVERDERVNDTQAGAEWEINLTNTVASVQKSFATTNKSDLSTSFYNHSSIFNFGNSSDNDIISLSSNLFAIDKNPPQNINTEGGNKSFNPDKYVNEELIKSSTSALIEPTRNPHISDITSTPERLNWYQINHNEDEKDERREEESKKGIEKESEETEITKFTLTSPVYNNFTTQYYVSPRKESFLSRNPDMNAMKKIVSSIKYPPIPNQLAEVTTKSYNNSLNHTNLPTNPNVIQKEKTLDYADEKMYLLVHFIMTRAPWTDGLMDKKDRDYRVLEWKIKAIILDERKFREFPFFFKISNFTFSKGSVITTMEVEIRIPNPSHSWRTGKEDQERQANIKELEEIIPTAFKAFILDTFPDSFYYGTPLPNEVNVTSAKNFTKVKDTGNVDTIGQEYTIDAYSLSVEVKPRESYSDQILKVLDGIDVIDLVDSESENEEQSEEDSILQLKEEEEVVDESNKKTSKEEASLYIPRASYRYTKDNHLREVIQEKENGSDEYSKNIYDVTNDYTAKYYYGTSTTTLKAVTERSNQRNSYIDSRYSDSSIAYSKLPPIYHYNDEKNNRFTTYYSNRTAPSSSTYDSNRFSTSPYFYPTNTSPKVSYKETRTSEETESSHFTRNYKTDYITNIKTEYSSTTNYLLNNTYEARGNDLITKTVISDTDANSTTISDSPRAFKTVLYPSENTDKEDYNYITPYKTIEYQGSISEIPELLRKVEINYDDKYENLSTISTSPNIYNNFDVVSRHSKLSTFQDDLDDTHIIENYEVTQKISDFKDTTIGSSPTFKLQNNEIATSGEKDLQSPMPIGENVNFSRENELNEKDQMINLNEHTKTHHHMPEPITNPDAINRQNSSETQKLNTLTSYDKFESSHDHKNISLSDLTRLDKDKAIESRDDNDIQNNVNSLKDNILNLKTVEDQIPILNRNSKDDSQYFRAGQIRAIVLATCICGSVFLVVAAIFCRQAQVRRGKRRNAKARKLKNKELQPQTMNGINGETNLSYDHKPTGNNGQNYNYFVGNEANLNHFKVIEASHDIRADQNVDANEGSRYGREGQLIYQIEEYHRIKSNAELNNNIINETTLGGLETNSNINNKNAAVLPHDQVIVNSKIKKIAPKVPFPEAVTQNFKKNCDLELHHQKDDENDGEDEYDLKKFNDATLPLYVGSDISDDYKINNITDEGFNSNNNNGNQYCNNGGRPEAIVTPHKYGQSYIASTNKEPVKNSDFFKDNNKSLTPKDYKSEVKKKYRRDSKVSEIIEKLNAQQNQNQSPSEESDDITINTSKDDRLTAFEKLDKKSISEFVEITFSRQ